MRKHFLLLFLMALLPLAGWADAADVNVTGLTLKARTYNAQPQALLEGTYSLPADYDTSVGKVLFVANTTNTLPTSEVGATEAYPAETNAGLYYVYYKVKADGGTYDTDGAWTKIGTTGVRINKATPQMTAPVGYSNLRYTEGPQALIKTAGFTDFGVMKYSLNQTDWYTADEMATNIQGTDVNDYIVYYKAVEDAGDNLINNTGSIVVRIHGIAPTLQAPIGAVNLVYDGTAKQLIATAGAVTTGDGDMVYSLNKTDWYDDIAAVDLKVTNANVEGYRVYYKMINGANYEDTEEHYITVPIAKRDISNNDDIVITPGALTFSGAPLVHTNTLTVKDGSTDLVLDTDFEISSANYSNNVNAGNAAVAAITGKGNYTGTKTKPFTINALAIDGLTGSLAPTIAAVYYNKSAQQPVISWTLSGDYQPTVYNNPNGDYSIVIKDVTETDEVPNPKDAATYRVIITGHNNLSGTKTVDYVINPAAVTVTADAKEYGMGAVPVYTSQITSGQVYSGDNLGALTYKVTANNVTDPAAVAGAPAADIAHIGTYNIWPQYAGNANYTITPAYGTLTITAGQVIAKVVAQTTKKFGEPFNAFSIEHFSGLPEGDAGTVGTIANFNANAATIGASLEYTVYKEDGTTPATKVSGKDYYPAGNYVVKATGVATYDGGNYSVVVQKANCTVNPRSINDVTIAPLTAQYIGAEVLPATAGKLTFDTNLELVKSEDAGQTGDFTIALKSTPTNTVDNVNVSSTKTGKVTITGYGNYTGTREENFTITRAPLTITADPADWYYGKEEPTYTATVPVGAANNGLVGQDAEKDLTTEQDGFNAVLKVRRISASTVGEYAQALEPYFADDEGNIITGNNISQNYTITLVKNSLSIKKSDLAIKVKDVQKKYGTNFVKADDFVFEIADDATNTGLLDVVKDNIDSYLSYQKNDCELETAAKYEVGNNYAITFDISKVSATNFNIVSVASGNFTVSKRPITLTAKAQAVNLSTPGSVFKTALIDGTTVDVAGDGLATGDVIDDLGVTLMYETFHVGNDNVINFDKTNANANYNFTYVNDGIYLTVTGAATVVFADYSDIQTYAGQPVTVKMNFTPRNGRKYDTTETNTYDWKAGMWTTMVLPFDISVADLSKALGYAIVNVINPGRTEVSGTGSKFYGKLTMTGGNGYHAGQADADTKLAANKPFLLKLADDIDTSVDYNFGLQQIVDPADEAARTVDAGGDCKFIGTYTAKDVTKDDKAAIWFMNGNEEGWQFIGATSDASWTIVPFEAYIDMSALSGGARNMVFYVEDIDGSVTAINGITNEVLGTKLNAEGWYTINGVKLQSAPVEKGIYINNGKKIVIR